MLGVLALRDSVQTEPAVQAILAALSCRPGFLAGHGARGIEEPHQWLVISRWRSLGDYRRALGATEVKLALGPLHPLLLDAVQAGGYEETDPA
ncbi:MAG: antibiotic biosynthesis monooxygenase family protein [Mycobacteriales bacterium]